MERSIDDIEFRKWVLLLKKSGFKIAEIVDISEASERTVKDIIRTFSVLDVDTKLDHGYYTEEELRLINSGKKTKEIMKDMNRSYFVLRDKIKQDRKTKRKQEERNEVISGYRKPFTQNEYGFIKISYENGVPTPYIARILNRSEKSIRAFCTRNKISRGKGKGEFLYGL